jgi:hypothetical protein
MQYFNKSLKMSAGRIFAASPKSTLHISPGSVLFILASMWSSIWKRSSARWSHSASVTDSSSASMMQRMISRRASCDSFGISEMISALLTVEE